MADYLDFPGRRSSYRYWFLNDVTCQGIKAEPGNYMFVKPTNAGWVPVYVGVADDLSDRLPHHNVWPKAAALGATRVVAHTQHDLSTRKAEEIDLISYWNPPCNTQHRTTTPGSLLSGLR